MHRAIAAVILLAVSSAGFGWSFRNAEPDPEALWHHRNLGKAFYENPTTQLMAVDEFKKALDLAPDSARERINYGLALLRAGKTQEGIGELDKAQKQEPRIPHTWFNLGMAFKRDSEYEKAIAQFEQMIRLVPGEPISHYNLGVLYKLTAKADQSMRHFEESTRLDPNLAGPHFQLYNAYRTAGRADDAARELAAFQEIKKRTAGAAVPEDLEWSFFAEIFETIEPKAIPAAPSALRFRSQALAGKFEGAGAGLGILDAEGDGKPDLIAWSAAGAALYRNAAQPVQDSGLSELTEVRSVLPGDFNNDGLADLCVVTSSGAALYENKKGAFRKSPTPLPPGAYSSALWLDYDHDGDADLFLFGDKCVLARNNGAAGFSDQSAEFPFVPGRATAATDFQLISDTNGKDLVILYQDHEGVLYRDKLAGKYEALPLKVLPAGARSIVAWDIDHDGWIDLAAAYADGARIARNKEGSLQTAEAPAGAKGPLVFADLENRAQEDMIAGSSAFRALGQARFAAIQAVAEGEAVAVAAADFDEDGRADLALISAGGALQALMNDTASANRWLRVALTGVKNAKLAAGAAVEIKSGSDYQKRMYQGLPLLFGLNRAETVDTVRVTWPNGLIQNEPKRPTNKSENFKEAQRLSGSCPMIFTWNGKEFEFITDVLGVAPLGASSGDGGYFPLDHDEYIQIPHTALTPAQGRYEIRITEELREVSYLDKIELIAVDHPAEVEIFTNDKFKSPPFPEFRLFGVRSRIYPAAARDDAGRDVRNRLLSKDRLYPDDFSRTYSGIAEEHALTLDFGAAARDNRAILVLSGWVDWADGSTFLAASQERPGGLVFPYLQVRDKDGQWRTVIKDMGIPAGKPKTIVVDLSGKFLSASREVRIVTNLCVYWDEIFMSEDQARPKVRMTSIGPESADLHFRGFSTPIIHPERKQPEQFQYANKMALSMWNPIPGMYTRYGEVRPLLESADDRMVLMGSGDEIKMLFPADGLPPLPQGWRREFLLLVDGWAKDGDANTAFSQSVEPLPFHGMKGYPYPAAQQYPTDEIRNQYRLEYNTRPALRLLRPLAENRVR